LGGSLLAINFLKLSKIAVHLTVSVVQYIFEEEEMLEFKMVSALNLKCVPVLNAEVEFIRRTSGFEWR
jgi:hypothetical protein